MIKRFYILVPMLLSFAASANQTLSSVRVEQDVLKFQAPAIAGHSSASCVEVDNQGQWAVSIRSSQGQAIYAALLTAISTNRQVEVEGAGDCQDLMGTERPLALSLVF